MYIVNLPAVPERTRDAVGSVTAAMEECPGPKMNLSHSPKTRLDLLLIERGLFETREKAQRAILAGTVYVDGQKLAKAGTKVSGDCRLEITERPRYVSRGGLKLEGALAHFQIDPTAAVCLDIGASTGGFTDCLLQHGAARVYAYDVGHSQLDWKIRSDPRVVVREKINARHLRADHVPEPVSLCVIDVSFISLTLILPAVTGVLEAHRPDRLLTILALIKPQFELERAAVGHGGIVRDPAAHDRAGEKVRRFVADTLPSWRWTGIMESPILGAEGNKEFLACLQN